MEKVENKLYLTMDSMELLLNKSIEFTKKFLMDEENNRLTSWQSGGFLKALTQFLQDEINKLDITELPLSIVNQYKEESNKLVEKNTI